jgi:hypothetical protein
MEEKDLDEFLSSVVSLSDGRKELKAILGKYLLVAELISDGWVAERRPTLNGDSTNNLLSFLPYDEILPLWQRMASDTYRSLHSVDCHNFIGMMINQFLFERILGELCVPFSHSGSLMSIARHDWLPVYLFFKRVGSQTYFSVPSNQYCTSVSVFGRRVSVSYTCSEEVFRAVFWSHAPGKRFRDMVMSSTHNNFNGSTGGVLASLFEVYDHMPGCDDKYICQEIIWLVRNAPDDSSGISLICPSEIDRHTFVERKYPRQTHYSKSTHEHTIEKRTPTPESVFPLERVRYYGPIETDIVYTCECGARHPSDRRLKLHGRTCICEEKHPTGRDVQVALAVKSARQFDYVERASSVLYKHLLRDIVPSIFEFLHSP